jgi:CRP-like cAMP-binding protein
MDETSRRENKKGNHMFKSGHDETYKDGEIIFKEGNAGDWIYVILSGSVAISKKIGGKTYDLGLLGRDDVFGEFAYFGNVERTATARAVGRTTVSIVDRGVLDLEFHGLSDEFRAIVVNMVKKNHSSVHITGLESFTSEQQNRSKRVRKFWLNFSYPESRIL